MKRFTATEKWQKAWYRKLPPHLKCLWQFMCDHCDAAGVWEADWETASFLIGKKVTEEDLALFPKVAKINGNKFLIGSFVRFQYGQLSPDCRAHLPIQRLIEKHKVSNGYSKAIDSLKEKEQEEETETERKEGVQGEPAPPINGHAIRRDRGTREQLVAFAAELELTELDGDWFFNKCEGNGWKNNGKPILDWKATMRSWKSGGYFPSLKLSPPAAKEEAERSLHTKVSKFGF